MKDKIASRVRKLDNEIQEWGERWENANEADRKVIDKYSTLLYNHKAQLREIDLDLPSAYLDVHNLGMDSIESMSSTNPTDAAAAAALLGQPASNEESETHLAGQARRS